MDIQPGKPLLPAQVAEYLRSCAGKEMYPTDNAAVCFATLVHRGKIGIGRTIRRYEYNVMHAYKCKFCDGWHLGH